VGTVLIAINPFRMLPLYTPDVLERRATRPAHAGTTQRFPIPRPSGAAALQARLRSRPRPPPHRYHENGALGQAPHTYAIADNAYRNLIRDWKV